MARLILKSPYIKGGARAVNYAKYIGTRERVELVPDGRPATKKQEQLIASLVKDFPGAKKLPEYSEYHNSPTKVNASAFITQALEDNWSDAQQSDIYAEYIASALLHLWGCSPDDAGERLNGIQEVSGSIPLISTKRKIPRNHRISWNFSIFYNFSNQNNHIFHF